MRQKSLLTKGNLSHINYTTRNDSERTMRMSAQRNIAPQFRQKGQSSSRVRQNEKNETSFNSKPVMKKNEAKQSEFRSFNNMLMLKSIKKSIEDSHKGKIEKKIADSSLFKKLQAEFESLRKDYAREIDILKNEVFELEEQIVSEKKNLINLNLKKEKITSEVSRFNEELTELQERNYAMYWDVAARFSNQNNEEYEEFLELEDVPRGLTSSEIKKFMDKNLKENTFLKEEEKSTGPNESCCICCENVKNNEKVCLLSCGHMHHVPCLESWLLVNKICPLCRKEVIE